MANFQFDKKECVSVRALASQAPPVVSPGQRNAGATDYLPFLQNVPDGDHLLKAYNVSAISFSSVYVVGGTTNDPELSITVQFTAVNAGSVGFYWGGHLARGVASEWGAGNGAVSISGAPFHMRGIKPG